MNLFQLMESIETKQYALDVLNGKANPSKDTTPAYYDAEFGKMPYFLMIVSKVSGQGLGFIAFLHFLQLVWLHYNEKEFCSDDFTDAGKAMFNKAVQQGIIQQINKNVGLNLARHTYWKVVKEPYEVLRRIAI